MPIEKYYLSVPERKDCRKVLNERSYEIDTKLKLAKREFKTGLYIEENIKMRQFDHNGLMLAEYQGKLFERSNELDCSTAVFIRRFLHSDLLSKLDSNNSSSLSLDVCEGINSILEQFGDTDYGKVKYSKSALFWIGYMYRYISYTREQSTKFIMQLFNYRQMNDVYYSFHTQDPEWCIKSLLEINKLSENIFDNNARLKQIIREHGNY